VALVAAVAVAEAVEAVVAAKFKRKFVKRDKVNNELPDTSQLIVNDKVSGTLSLFIAVGLKVENKGEKMKKSLVVAGLVVGMIVPTIVMAQGPGGGGGFGGGGGGQRSMKGRLSGVIRGIGELEKSNKASLNKDQARKVLSFVRPWQGKPHMNDDEAKGLYMKINGVLNTKQKNELDRAAAQNRRLMGGGGGFGGGGRQGGGPGGPGGGNPADFQKFRQQMQQMQGFFKTYNPFYPPTSYKEFKQMPDRMKDRFTKGYQARVALLAKLAQVAR